MVGFGQESKGCNCKLIMELHSQSIFWKDDVHKSNLEGNKSVLNTFC